MILFQLGILVFHLFVASFNTQTPPANLQTIPEVNAAYSFGEKLFFQGTIDEQSAIQDIIVFWKVSGTNDTVQQGRANLNTNQFTFEHDLKFAPLPPFANIEYWIGITYNDGSLTTGDKKIFIYEDNRFEWQKQQDGITTIHWFEGDLGFAQQALDAANIGFERAKTILPSISNSQEQINIYIYPNAKLVQEALQLSGYSWVAGHTDPRINTVLVSITPSINQRAEMERQIPHEIMHILLYRMVTQSGGAYTNIPAWLLEGLATQSEIYPNPDYPVILNESQQTNGLLPLTSLCRSFPKDPSSAILAYAQSAYFTRYIQQQYGSSQVENLLQTYSDGVECERGTEVALGIELTNLEQQWITQIFGVEDPTKTDLNKATPWFSMLGLIVIFPLIIFVIRYLAHPSHAK
jgi:hypothetical protein